MVLCAGCAESQIQISEAGNQVRQVETFLSEFETAYAQGDLITLRSFFSDTFQQEHAALFEAAQGSFLEAEQVEIQLIIDVIHADGEQLRVLLHWEGQLRSPQGLRRQRGNTTLLLTQGETLLITAFEGEPPFMVEDRISKTPEHEGLPEANIGA